MIKKRNAIMTISKRRIMTEDERTIEHLKNLCRFLAKYHEETMQLRNTIALLAKKDPGSVEQYVAMKWPIVQGTMNQIALTKISKQDCDVAQAVAGMEIMAAETRSSMKRSQRSRL